MTTASSTPGPSQDEIPRAPDTRDQVRIRGPLRRLLVCFGAASVGVYAVWGAVPGILLPLQIGSIDPAHKAGNLALVATVGAFVAMIAQPVAGAISDRTRSRYGPRAPWLLCGGLVGGLAMTGLAFSSTLLSVGIAWCAVQFAYNFAQGPLSAVLPDRVPQSARGRFAAVLGGATMVGGLGGSVVAARLSGSPRLAYTGFAVLLLLLLMLFTALNPDRSSRDVQRVPFRLTTLLRTFWVNPRLHPDFGWAFLSRILLYTGYFTVIGYQLYLLQDYAGEGSRAVQLVPLLGLAALPAILLSVAVCGPLSDRWGRRKPFVLGASVVVAAGVLVPWAVPSLTGMLVCAIVTGLGFGAFQAVDTALMSQVLPSSGDFAKDLGVVNIAATLPQTVAPAVAGAIVVGVGYAGLFPLAALLSVLGALAVLPIRGVR